MKRTLLLLILSLNSYNIYSQDKLGVFGGVNASTFSHKILKETGMHSNSFSFHFGGAYELNLAEKISFRPKLVYSQQGDREDSYDNIRYETSYINLPLNFKFFKTPYLLIGPQLGYLLHTKKNDFDYGELEPLDYGLNLGVGLDIHNFFLELNLYQGFNELIDVKYT